jgi:glyoxylase-like metal-dependent hydrolase (beta-lactamase superfamily II)
MGEIVNDGKVKINKLELGPFDTNSYIVVCSATAESLIVDAPGDPERVLQEIGGTSPRYLVITHNHGDHTGALSTIKEQLHIPVAMNPVDAGKMGMKPEIELLQGALIKLGRLDIQVIHTPGHTPGSICLLLDGYLLAGDTLFPGGPGKTATPEAFQQIVDSITGKILTLPDDTRILPGHGDSATVGQAKEEFAIFNSKPHSKDLCGEVLWLTS